MNITRLLLIFLGCVAFSLHGQTIATGDIVFSKKNASGPYALVPVTPAANGILVFDGSGNLDVASSLAQSAITNLTADLAAKQPLDADLTAIAALIDPNADRLLFWDDSAGAYTYLTLGTGLSITGTTLNASVTSPAGADTQVQFNNAGVFGADAGFTYSGGDLVVGVQGDFSGQLVLHSSGTSGSVVMYNGVHDTVLSSSGTASRAIVLPDASGTLLLADNAATVTGKAISGADNTITAVAPASITGTAATLGANTFTALQTITQGSANAGVLASTGYSLTGSDATSMINWAGTLNTSGSPNVIYANMTDTASGANTRLFRLDTNTTHRFSVANSGEIRYSSDNHGFGSYGAGEMVVRVGGSDVLLVRSNGNMLSILGDHILNLNGSASCFLVGVSNNVIAMRNGASAQTFQINNTSTDTTTFERLNLGWSSNVGIIGTEKGSVGGTARDLDIQTDGTTRVKIKSTGEFTLPAGNMILSGAGTPEAAVTAPVGSLFLRTDGGAATTLYVKESGAGNTGWVGK